MNDTCELFQQYLLDPEAGPADPDLHQHGRRCAACAAVERNATVGDAVMRRFAASGAGAQEFGLPADLRQRVLSAALKRSRREAAASAGAADASSPAVPTAAILDPHSAAPEPVAARKQRRPARRVQYWSAAAALLFILLGAWALRQSASLGRVTYAEGTLRLGEAAAPLAAAATIQLHRKEMVETVSDSRGILDLDKGRVRLAMSEDTKLKMLGNQHLSLRRGEVWLSVTPGGEGFLIDTPFGRVQVTGTIFSVAVEPGATHVEVIQGSVRVSKAAEEITVRGGEQVHCGESELGIAQARPDGARLPAWVNTLLQNEARAHGATFLPSLIGSHLNPPGAEH